MTTAHEVIAAILGIDRESHQELVLTLHSRVEQQRQRAEAAEATIKELREQLRLCEQAREKAERRLDA
jgi:cell division protein FtsL